MKERGWVSTVRISATILFAGMLPLWLWFYLRPDTWRCYTDEVEFSRIKRHSKPQLVVWGDAQAIAGAVNKASHISEPAISPDGSVMAFSRRVSKENADIFFSKWNGREWQEPAPARALNSLFNEKDPAFSRDGTLLYFSTDRPGGPGGYDIWVSRWDGAEYAWPAPLTIMVNSPYDDVGPSPSCSEEELYFSSNRPRHKDEKKHENEETAVSYIIEEKQTQPAEDFDIFSAHIIPSGVTNREVERAISMLYYLREAALSDESVMRKLGGSRKSEKAVDRSLEYLKARQEDDGSWRTQRNNKQGKHDVACTSLALLAYFGRGHRHDQAGPYQDTVSRGIDWLIGQQKPLGELYGRGDFYDQAMGALALGEAYGLTKDEKVFDAAHTAIDYIVECQNADGGWRYNKGQSPSDLSVSGWMIMALKNAEFSGLYVPAETFEGIRKWLTHVGGGKHGGIFGYQNNADNRPAMKVTGYFCSQLMGLSPNTLKSFEAAEEMHEKGPVADDFYYVYYGTLAANQHQGPLWKKWQKSLPDTLLPLQQKDGSWYQSQGNHAGEMREVVGTALITLSLQAHYRYTPMYGLGYEPDESKAALSVKNRDELSDIPLYRRAKRRNRLSSSRDDIHPAPTEHGDFIYFSSDREGGYGGFDVYRSRISGETPTRPENLGTAVNGPDDETAPTTRAAGFDLIYSSNRGQGDEKDHRLYSSVSRRVHIETNPLTLVSPLWFVKTFVWQMTLGSIAVLFFVHWTTKLRVRQAAKAPRGPRPTLSLRVVYIVKRWTLPVVCVLVVLGSALSIRSVLKRTVWRFYTDGEDIKRSAVTEHVRSVLWNTHITLGELNRPRPIVKPVFSPDETELIFDYISAKTGQPVHYTSKWNGLTWSKAQNVAEEEEKKGKDLPAAISHFPRSSDVSGGYAFFASDERQGRGGHDIYFAPVHDRDSAVNLGPFVNSKDNDMSPSARMEGFDLMFISDRGQEEENKYVLFTSTAREVVEHMDYTRWRNLMSLLDRLKWWIFAMVVAAAGLIYLAKHWNNMNSLFHQCLLGSLGLHLLLLLIMAFWMISAELVDSVETTAMEVSVDVDALAQQKLALELEQDVTEMEHLAEAPEMDRQQQEAPEIRLPEPETMEETPLVEVRTTEESFVAEVEPVEFAEPETEKPEVKELEPLPELEMPEVEIVLEMEEAPTEERREEGLEETEPVVTQEVIEIAKLEIEEPRPEVEKVEAEIPELSVPDVEMAPVEIPVVREPPPVSGQPETTMAEPKLMPVETMPEMLMPEMELEARSLEATEATEEYKPETTQKAIDVEQAAHAQPATDAVPELAETAELAISNILAFAAMEELMTATASSDAETRQPGEIMELQSALPEMEAAETYVAMEARATATKLKKTEEFAPTAFRTSSDVKRASTPIPVSRMVAARTTKADVKLVVEQQTLNKQRIMDAQTIRTSFSAIPPTTGELAETPRIEQSRTAIEITAPAIVMEGPVALETAAEAEEFTPAYRVAGSTTKRWEVDLSARKVGYPAKQTEITVETAVQLANVESTVDVEAVDIAFSRAGPAQSLQPRPASRVSAELPEMAAYLPTVELSVPSRAGRTVTDAAEFVPAGVQSTPATARKVVRLPSSVRNTAVRALPDTPAGRPAKGVVNRVPIETTLPSRLPPVLLEGMTEFAPAAISAEAAGPELQIDLPGKLSIPPGAAAKLIPEIVKNPGELSEEIIESLGGSADTQGSIVEALEWFTKNQEKDGHWSLGRHGGNSAHDIGGTSLVLLCYYGWGAKHNREGKHRETVKRALEWLIARMREDGDLRGWLRRRYEDDRLLGNMYDHSIATIALCEAYNLTSDDALLEPSKRAVEFLLKAQNKELGGWRYIPGKDSDTSSLGWAYMALRSAQMAGIEVPKEAFEKADSWLKSVSGGKAGGVFGYRKHEAKRPAMVATGMFCRQLAGVPKTDPSMHEGASYLSTHPLDAEEIDFYYMYYGTLVLYQQQGPVWEKWNARMKAVLLAKQHKKGRKAGSWDPAMWYDVQMGRVGATACGTLSLEVYYRLLPMYGFDTGAGRAGL